jgi:hypothetical protein
MGPDRKKQFLKKNSDLVPAGEEVLAVVIAEPKGGAWRRGMRSYQAGPLANALSSVGEGAAPGGDEGEASTWPDARLFWLVLTDKQLHAFEGRVNSQDVGPGAAHFPLERIASMSLDKKLLISKLNVSFKDGTGVELDVSKQKVEPFVEAINAHSG